LDMLTGCTSNRIFGGSKFLRIVHLQLGRCNGNRPAS
jgi:hypothetical protein